MRKTKPQDWGSAFESVDFMIHHTMLSRMRHFVMVRIEHGIVFAAASICPNNDACSNECTREESREKLKHDDSFQSGWFTIPLEKYATKKRLNVSIKPIL